MCKAPTSGVDAEDGMACSISLNFLENDADNEPGRSVLGQGAGASPASGVGGAPAAWGTAGEAASTSLPGDPMGPASSPGVGRGWALGEAGEPLQGHRVVWVGRDLRRSHLEGADVGVEALAML